MSSATSTSNIEVSKVLMRDIKQSTMLKFGNVTQISKRQRVHDGGAPLCIDAMDDELEEGEEPDSSSKKGERRALWQDDWLQSFKWLVYDNERVRLFCSFCLDYPHSKSAYAKQGSRNFKTSNLKSHARTQCHRDARNAKLFGKTALKEGLKKMNTTQEDALLNLFKAAFFIGKNSLPFALYPSLLSLMKETGVKCMTSLYNDDKACTEIIQCLAKSIMDETLAKVRESPWFGVMVDESTDIAIHHHMVVYISYLEKGCVPCTSFYGMIRTHDSSAQGIYATLMLEMEKANLDITKLTAFGSDGCSTMVSDLSKRFQKDYVDVTTIHGIVQSTILCIKDDYLEERNVDLNASQKGVGDFPIMPEYGSENGFLHALRSSLRGDMFFGQKIMRDVEGGDLMRALQFQFAYAQKLCESLEKRFVDNSILRCLKIMVPAQHPIHEKALKDFGMSECAEIVCFYGEEKNVDGKIYAPLIDGNSFKDEFRKFKRQVAIDFAKMGLCHVTSLLASNDSLKDMYPNVLKVAQIALVQCCSTAVCERGFSSRTKIKNKWRNRLEIESLDALLVISIEGDEGMDFSNAMDIWKKLARRHLFAANGSTTIDDKQESSGAASSIRRNILVGVVATGAALAVFSNSSMAAIGPGGDGNRRTAEKADELLKAADKLNIEDAPKRFGPGRPGPVQDPTKISQIAGSGSGAVAKEGAAAAEEGEKLGDAARSAIGQAQSKPSQLGAAARDAVGQADTKKFSDDLGNAEGGVFKPFQQGFKNLRDTAERTGSEARSTVADVVSKNKP
ncbi:hypothetical protein L7F22_055277 [Adiantum nelumboides]|nr:hypothetical protein [Adiantum nelumboides]